MLLVEVPMSKDPHADGQKDYGKGEYNPPHSITPLDHLIHSDHTVEKMQEENDQYDDGYSNARNQK